MPPTSSAVSSKILQEAKRWLISRWQECVRCSECDQPVMPFDTLCPNCGQGNPAKVSAWAGVYMVAAVALVALLGTVLV